MARPTTILPAARGMARDSAIDQMPAGFVWDLADYLPNRRGAKLESRGPWSYFTTAVLGASPWGGKHAAFRAGSKLLVGAAGWLWDVDQVSGVPTFVANVPNGIQNGVLLRDRVYFADAAGAGVPKVVTLSGTTLTVGNCHTSAPKATVLAVYKERLIAAGVPASVGDPSIVYFSPLETQGTAPNVGPLSQWDVKSVIGTTRAVTALFPMSAQILVFHDGSIERIKGSIPPASNLNTDMYVDTFSEQIGTSDPASVTPWQENVCFANAHGVYLTDGATMRSLTDQGGIGDLWRQAFSQKKAGTQVHATVFLDQLFVTILTSWTSSTPDEQRPLTLVCDLGSRTWMRFKNVHATCYIDTEIGTEESYWGVDSSVAGLGNNMLAKISPMYFGPNEFDPDNPPGSAPDAVDGNGLAVLPHLRTGFVKLGPEGVKRVRHVYVSHMTQAIPTNRADVYQVSARVNPLPHVDMPAAIGKLPAYPGYRRNRLRLDRRGYGVQVDIQAVQPAYLSRLYDISVDEWAQDRGKL